MATGGQKLNFDKICSKIAFWLGKWIPFIRFGQNLAGKYYLTQGTSLRKNFWPIPKSKMAPAGKKNLPLNIYFSFDRRQPSWILRKTKNSSAGLFLGSSSISMPNIVLIGWTGSELFKKSKTSLWTYVCFFNTFFKLPHFFA